MEHSSGIDLVAIFTACLAFVNGSVALMKSPALSDFWRQVLPWWGKLVFFVVVAAASAILQALVAGAPPMVAVVLGLGAVGSAITGHEMLSLFKDAKQERLEEQAEREKSRGG